MVHLASIAVPEVALDEQAAQRFHLALALTVHPDTLGNVVSAPTSGVNEAVDKGEAALVAHGILLPLLLLLLVLNLAIGRQPPECNLHVAPEVVVARNDESQPLQRRDTGGQRRESPIGKAIRVAEDHRGTGSHALKPVECHVWIREGHCLLGATLLDVAAGCHRLVVKDNARLDLKPVRKLLGQRADGRDVAADAGGQTHGRL
eukprot:188872-Prymnesium_polylepis.1